MKLTMIFSKDLIKRPACNFSLPQFQQQWFSVGIFPLGLLFGLTGIEDQRW
jgi:hypothetical protein